MVLIRLVLAKAATAGAGEKSPLLMPQKYQQQQRQLGSHGAIQGSDDYGLLANISPGSSPMNNLGTIKDASLQEAVGSPPLLVWIGPALFCALCYALYNIFIKVRKLAIVGENTHLEYEISLLTQFNIFLVTWSCFRVERIGFYQPSPRWCNIAASSCDFGYSFIDFLNSYTREGRYTCL